MSETVYERFETNADFQAAVDRLLQQPGGAAHLRSRRRRAAAERSAAPRAPRGFLMSSRTRRIYLVLHNTDP